MTDEQTCNSNLNLTVKTYNCRGLNSSKKSYVVNLLSDCNFLFIQEHWLSSSQLSELNFLSPNHYGVVVSCFGNDDVLRGRPYDGCAILWRRDIRAEVQFFTTDSRRVSALCVDFTAVKLLFINVYLTHEDSEANFDEFSFQLSIVNNVIEMH